jgi:hypothetical protein
MLACRARGLGTAWTTLHLQYEAEIAGLLGLPGDIRQGALIPTAYYTGDTFRPAAPAASGRAERRSLVDAIADLGEPYAPGTTGKPAAIPPPVPPGHSPLQLRSSPAATEIPPCRLCAAANHASCQDYCTQNAQLWTWSVGRMRELPG